MTQFSHCNGWKTSRPLMVPDWFGSMSNEYTEKRVCMDNEPKRRKDLKVNYGSGIPTMNSDRSVSGIGIGKGQRTVTVATQEGSVKLPVMFPEPVWKPDIRVLSAYADTRLPPLPPRYYNE